MLSKEISLNHHHLPQIVVGLCLGAWLYLFLVLIGPFDAVDVTLQIRSIIMVGYGLVFFLCYIILIPIQNAIFNHLQKWTILTEILTITLFCIYALPAIFTYYKTDLVNGTYNFAHFSLEVYLPTLLLILPIIFLGRFLAAKFLRIKNIKVYDAQIILSGANKLDILKISPSELIAVEAASNYVNVYYLVGDKIQNKLLRNTLRNVGQNASNLIQVHRSFLVNMDFFREWKDHQMISVHGLDIPVSKKYKSNVVKKTSFIPE